MARFLHDDRLHLRSRPRAANTPEDYKTKKEEKKSRQFIYRSFAGTLALVPFDVHRRMVDMNINTCHCM